jgi:hypothetical protein
MPLARQCRLPQPQRGLGQATCTFPKSMRPSRSSLRVQGAFLWPTASRRSHPPAHPSPSSLSAAGLGDVIRDMFDFEKWAPRSSQAWRFGQEPVYRNRVDSGAGPSTPKISEDDIDVLNRRMDASRASIGSVDLSESDAAAARPGEEAEQPSFLASTDEEFADALNSRITQVAATAPPGNAAADGDASGGLSGAALAELIYEKYGKRHDVGFVRRDIPGKTLVSLNVYHAHLGQRSFKMDEEEYLEKMDGVVLYLEAWGQADTVVAFLKSPVAPRRGLPSRPIVGNAVSIMLDLSREQIVEWFGR